MSVGDSASTSASSSILSVVPFRIPQLTGLLFLFPGLLSPSSFKANPRPVIPIVRAFFPLASAVAKSLLGFLSYLAVGPRLSRRL